MRNKPSRSGKASIWGQIQTGWTLLQTKRRADSGDKIMLTQHQNLSAVCQSFLLSSLPQCHVVVNSTPCSCWESDFIQQQLSGKNPSKKNCRVKVWLPSLYLLQTFLIVCTHHKHSSNTILQPLKWDLVRAIHFITVSVKSATTPLVLVGVGLEWKSVKSNITAVVLDQSLFRTKR